MSAYKKTNADHFEISPSDLGQAKFRVALVSAVVIWTVLSADTTQSTEFFREPHFLFALLYWVISFVVYLWTRWYLVKTDLSSVLYPVTRGAGILTDVGAASVYTAISGEAGIILYPIYLTISIGYGYRFGVSYLYLALLTSAAFFGIAAQHNSYIANNTNLIWTYYLGIALVPLYSASLLNRHRDVIERIKEVNSARTRFIANMSHELRTPLHAIISVADLLAEDSKDLGTHKADSSIKLRMIGDSAHHLLALVNRVLDIASADASGMTLTRQNRIKLDDTVCASLRICQPNAESKDVGFYWFYDVDLPKYVWSSTEYLQEILINTVGNAVKYTPEGYIFVGFFLDRDNADPTLRIVVKDTGIGISNKLLPSIFEPFTLGDDSAARSFSGTGLGLTLTKQFVENLGGDISFESIEGSGTECTIKLPCLPHEDIGIDSTEIENLLSCILISPRLVRSDEINSFLAAGWNCKVIDRTSFESQNFASYDAIFIDSAYHDSVDLILEPISSRTSRTLISLYVTTPVETDLQRLDLNAIVEMSNLLQLRSANSLTFEMFGETTTGSVGSNQFEDLGIEEILVADDNSTNLTTARLALEACGLNVTTVSSGEQALHELENRTFQLAFIDLHMPSMSGVEVMEIYQFLFVDSRTPVVMLTADATKHARESALDAGAVAVLTKPVRVDDLRNAVLQYASTATSTISDSIPEPTALSERDNTIRTDADAVDYTIIEEFLDLGISSSELNEMLNEFLSDGEALINDLKIADRSRNHERTRGAMHSLKGVCTTVGATSVWSYIETKVSEAKALRRPLEQVEFDRFSSMLVDNTNLLREKVNASNNNYTN